LIPRGEPFGRLTAALAHPCRVDSSPSSTRVNMKQAPLINAATGQVSHWLCGECHSVHRLKEQAVKCCRLATCKSCSTPVKRTHTLCYECIKERREQRYLQKWEQAQRFELGDQKGEYLYCDQLSSNDGFFKDEDLEEEIFEWLQAGRSIKDFPTRFFDTRPERARFDAEDLCASLCDDYPEAYDSLVNIDMLQSMLNDWCGMQPVLYWLPDYNRAVDCTELIEDLAKEIEHDLRR